MGPLREQDKGQAPSLSYSRVNRESMIIYRCRWFLREIQTPKSNIQNTFSTGPLGPFSCSSLNEMFWSILRSLTDSTTQKSLCLPSLALHTCPSFLYFSILLLSSHPNLQWFQHSTLPNYWPTLVIVSLKQGLTNYSPQAKSHLWLIFIQPMRTKNDFFPNF